MFQEELTEIVGTASVVAPAYNPPGPSRCPVTRPPHPPSWRAPCASAPTCFSTTSPHPPPHGRAAHSPWGGSASGAPEICLVALGLSQLQNVGVCCLWRGPLRSPQGLRRATRSRATCPCLPWVWCTLVHGLPALAGPSPAPAPVPGTVPGTKWRPN